MRTPTDILALFKFTVQAWWQRGLEQMRTAPPYPLVAEEWECTQEVAEVSYQGPVAEENARKWVNASGRLVDINVGAAGH